MIFADENEAVLMMTDEAHLHLCGYVTKQNCQYWAAENPRALHQRLLLHSESHRLVCCELPACARGSRNCNRAICFYAEKLPDPRIAKK